MASKYQKRHYEDVAEILATALGHSQHEGPAWSPYTFQSVELFAEDFADLFAADNPLFDRERFLKACGLE